jgi:hypothetical protein
MVIGVILINYCAGRSKILFMVGTVKIFIYLFRVLEFSFYLLGRSHYLTCIFIPLRGVSL